MLEDTIQCDEVSIYAEVQRSVAGPTKKTASALLWFL